MPRKKTDPKSLISPAENEKPQETPAEPPSAPLDFQSLRDQLEAQGPKPGTSPLKAVGGLFRRKPREKAGSEQFQARLTGNSESDAKTGTSSGQGGTEADDHTVANQKSDKINAPESLDDQLAARMSFASIFSESDENKTSKSTKQDADAVPLDLSDGWVTEAAKKENQPEAQVSGDWADFISSLGGERDNLEAPSNLPPSQKESVAPFILENESAGGEWENNPEWIKFLHEMQNIQPEGKTARSSPDEKGVPIVEEKPTGQQQALNREADSAALLENSPFTMAETGEGKKDEGDQVSPFSASWPDLSEFEKPGETAGIKPLSSRFGSSTTTKQEFEERHAVEDLKSSEGNARSQEPSRSPDLDLRALLIEEKPEKPILEHPSAKEKMTLRSWLKARMEGFYLWQGSLSKVEKGLAIFILLLLSLIIAAGALTIIFSRRASPVNQTRAVISLKPVRLDLPGGITFPLQEGSLNKDGNWEPLVPEWLAGTELLRMVSIPWSKQTEALIRTFSPGDDIHLSMTDGSSIQYQVKRVEQVNRTDVSTLQEPNASLVIILSQPDSEMRWIVICSPVSP